MSSPRRPDVKTEEGARTSKLLSLLDSHAIRLALYTLAGSFLFLTGIYGLGRPDSGLLNGGQDFEYMHVAGRLWLNGESPYDTEAFQRLFPYAASAFAYPPVVAPLCMLLAIFPFKFSYFIWTTVNFISLLVIVRCSVLLAAPSAKHASRVFAVTLFLALLSPFSSHVLWMGQTSLLAMALVTALMVAGKNGREWLSGGLCALAMMKPQLSLLPVLWVMVTYRPGWHFYLSGALASALLIAHPVFVSGSDLIREYLISMEAYRSAEPQAAGWRHMLGLGSLGAALGVELPSLLPLGLILVVFAWMRRSRFSNDAEILSLLTIVALLFLFAHNYDLVALIPLVPAVYLRGLADKRVAWFGLASLLILYFPQRLLVPFDVPLLLRYRELLLLALTAWLFTEPKGAHRP